MFRHRRYTQIRRKGDKGTLSCSLMIRLFSEALLPLPVKEARDSTFPSLTFLVTWVWGLDLTRPQCPESPSGYCGGTLAPSLSFLQDLSFQFVHAAASRSLEKAGGGLASGFSGATGRGYILERTRGPWEHVHGLSTTLTVWPPSSGREHLQALDVPSTVPASAPVTEIDYRSIQKV